MRAVRARGCPRVRSFLCAMRPPGHVYAIPDTVTVGAAHRSAARAWGARPVPFRTRKLSPIAPRVLRGQPVGGQGAADRWTAPSRTLELGRGRPRGLPPFLFKARLGHLILLFCGMGFIVEMISRASGSCRLLSNAFICCRVLPEHHIYFDVE